MTRQDAMNISSLIQRQTDSVIGLLDQSELEDGERRIRASYLKVTSKRLSEAIISAFDRINKEYQNDSKKRDSYVSKIGDGEPEEYTTLVERRTPRQLLEDDPGLVD